MPIQQRWLKHFSWHNFLRRCGKSWHCQTKQTLRILQKKRTGSWKFPNFHNSQINSTSGFRKSGGRNPDSKQDQHPVSKSDHQWPLLPGLCKYHSKFGVRARSYLPPCKLHNISGAGKRPNFSEPGNGTPGHQ